MRRERSVGMILELEAGGKGVVVNLSDSTNELKLVDNDWERGGSPIVK